MTFSEKQSHTIRSVAEMEALAASLLASISSGTVLLLYGELGAGKTTFTRALASALGITDDVTSPTFTIVGEYPIPAHSMFKTLVHADLYRFEGESAGADPMIKEMLRTAGEAGRLTVIEWAERLGAFTVPEAVKITFRHGAEEGTRIVEVG
jgi:tRNA threonylcarbamoyladenosine biosynthesis protein TsaE